MFFGIETEVNALNLHATEVVAATTPNNTTGNPHATSTGSGHTGGAGSGKFNSDNGSGCSSVTSESIPPG